MFELKDPKKDPISLERIICNSADDFEYALGVYDFLLASTILCAEDGADKKLFKAVKSRRDINSTWDADIKIKKIQEAQVFTKTYNVHKFSINSLNSFESIGRMALLILNAAFEKRIKDMLYIWYAAEINNFEIKKTLYLTKDQQRLINQQVEAHWNADTGRGKDSDNLKSMLIQLATDMHFKLRVSSEESFYWRKYTDENKYEKEVVKKISEECWSEIKDAYLLRNAITHNRNKSTKKITIGRQTFERFCDIDPEQSSINKIISNFRKIHELFPQNPDSFFC